MYRDEDRMAGCSPDFMVESVGTASQSLEVALPPIPGELECPLPHNHLIWLIEGGVPREHFPQCQGHIWVTEAPFCEFMSYCPELPPLYVRVMPDEGYQKALDKHLPTFIGEILNGRDRLRDMGVTK